MKLRVAHLITKLELGGAQQNTLYTLENLPSDRYEKYLLVGPGGILDEEARSSTEYETVFLPHLVREVSPLRDLKTLMRLRRELRRITPDIVHTHSSKAGVLGRLAARAAKVPVVIHSIHGFGFSVHHPLVRRVLFRWAECVVAPMTTRFFAVSHANAKWGSELGIFPIERVDVVRSGIQVEGFPGVERAAARAALGLPDDVPVVGTVACLKPQKAPLDTARVWARVAREHPEALFVLAGDGELRPELEEEISRLGIGDRVRLLGWRRDIESVYAAMDVFLLTSLWEGLPRSVLQARASGLPVVATSVDGTPEAVREGVTGFLVETRDVEGAAERVSRLLGDGELRRRMGEAARREMEEFRIQAMLERQDELYRRLAGAARGDVPPAS